MKNLDAPNEQYKTHEDMWKKCRDAIAGQEKVHAQGVKYLPMLSGQQDKPGSYDKYKLRSTFFNATGRTLDGMTGLIFRKPPIVEHPESLQQVIDDIDMGGTDFISFAEAVVDELCAVGRVGLLVDYPSVQSVGLTIGDAQRLGLRPYATIYKTESILDWRYGRINNKSMLTMVKLMESVEVQESEFEFKSIKQIRVLDLIEGRYRVRLYQCNEKNEWEQIGTDLYPLMNNAPIPEIPFVFASVNGLDSDCKKPPMLDLVNINYSHYRSMADYEHGLHFTGLPTPVFWGARIEADETINLGSEEALAFADPQGHAEYLEFTGSGLTQIKEALMMKQDMMALLGSKILSADKRAVEAAETAAIHRASENSVLASIANGASKALTRTLQWIAQWANSGEELSARLNTDYMPQEMTPQMFAELTKAYLTGTISYETYFAKLQEGEIIRAEVKIEDERELREPQELDLVE